jgi:hypothetical protein
MGVPFHDLIAFVSRLFRHFSLQYFTSSQTLAHFLRHLNGLPQTTQIFSGKLALFCGMVFQPTHHEDQS